MVKEFLRKLDWSFVIAAIFTFATFLFLIPFLYLQPLSSLFPTPPPIDYKRLCMGSLMAWLFTISITNNILYRDIEKPRSLIRDILRFLEPLFAFPLIFGSLFFLLTGIPMPIAQPLPIIGTIELFFIGYLFLWVWYQFLVKPQCVVSEDTLVIMDEKTYYPGERFNVYPFFKHHPRAVQPKLALNKKMTLNCLDGSYNVCIQARIHIDMKKIAQERLGVPFHYEHALNAGAENWLETCLQEVAKTVTIGQLMQTILPPKKTTINGIPITWNGEKTLSIAS